MKIRNYNDLEYAAEKKLAVYRPSSAQGPKPAAFVMNQDVRTINRAINDGLFIYVKENVQPKFFCGAGDSLMCDRHIEGLTRTFSHDVYGFDLAKKYEGWHIVGECMSLSAMKMICKQFNGIWIENKTGCVPF